MRAGVHIGPWSPILSGGVAFTPTDLSGLTHWGLVTPSTLFQLAGCTVPAADTDPVGCWVASAGGTNATEGDSIQQPLVNVVSGLYSLTFDAVNDNLSTTLSVTAPYTVVIAFSWNGSVNATRRVVQGSTNWLIGPYNGFITHFAGGFVASSSRAAVQFEKVVCVATNTGAASRFVVSGVDVTQNASPVDAPGTFHYGVGGAAPGEPPDSEVYEGIIYNRVLTDGEINQIGNYIAGRIAGSWAAL